MGGESGGYLSCKSSLTLSFCFPHKQLSFLDLLPDRLTISAALHLQVAARQRCFQTSHPPHHIHTHTHPHITKTTVDSSQPYLLCDLFSRCGYWGLHVGRLLTKMINQQLFKLVSVVLLHFTWNLQGRSHSLV